MTITEALKKIQETGVKVAPFVNYDKVTEVTPADDGLVFKPDEAEWPIHSVCFTKSGNLNLTFKQTGTLVEPDGARHACCQYRQVSVVRDGEYYLQFLQVTKDKGEQTRLKDAGIDVKNNIVNLGAYPLTDKQSVSVDEIFTEKVVDFLGSLNTAKTVVPAVELTDEQQRLRGLGLSPDGVYSRKCVATGVKTPNVSISIDGCSSKTTKAAAALKIATAGRTFPKSRLNEMVYTAKALKIHADRPVACVFDGRPFTGKIKI